MSEEGSIQKRTMLDLSPDGVVLFRNNVGQGWCGRKVGITKEGFLILADFRPVHFGLFQGSHDLIGWRRVLITPQMIGATAAIFTGLECKTEDGRLSTPQKVFHGNLENAGGISGVFHTPEEARQIVFSKY